MGTSSVNCTQVQFAWTINVGDKSSGTTAVIESGGGPLVARSVRLRDVDGFSGTYWDGNHGNAQASSDGGIWTVTGKMNGFNTATAGIDRATREFTIKANC